MTEKAEIIRERHAHFWKKLLRLTRGRVTVLRALEIIEHEEPHIQWREKIRRLRTEMDTGSGLSDAVHSQPEVFSLSVRELVRAAERSGAWDEIMQEIAEGLRDGTFD